MFTYPALSQTFVADEVEALRAEGFEVETWGISPTEEEALVTDRYRREGGQTRALRALSTGALARAHARAFRTTPAGYVRAARRALSDRAPGLRALVLGAGTFVTGIGLWDQLDRRGIRHVHVHFAGSPTHVAAFVSEFGNLARRDDPPWSWSVSLHGPVEFADLSANHVRERVRSALFVLAISDFGRSQILTMLPHEQWDKVRVLRCGIDLSKFDAAEPARTDGPLRILYVGRLVALKGQPILLEAFAALRRRGIDATLTLVGGGDERDDLERLAERLGVADRVTFTGGLGHDRVREQMAAADVFCLPSFAEGLPVVLMEAMASGLPVVATRIAGVSELVEDGVEGVVVRPGRVDELEQALVRFAEDREFRRRAGAAGRSKVEREHDIRRIGEQLAGIHREFRAPA